LKKSRTTDALNPAKNNRLFALSQIKKKKRTAMGQTLSLYLIFYSLERFLVEALRTDSLMIGPFKQAQVISIAAIVAGIILYRYTSKRYPLEK